MPTLTLPRVSGFARRAPSGPLWPCVIHLEKNKVYIILSGFAIGQRHYKPIEIAQIDSVTNCEDQKTNCEEDKL